MSRWLRLDTTWSASEWLCDLPPMSRLVWIELLCYVKAHGVDGRARRMAPEHFASRYVTGVTVTDVTALEGAAIAHGALTVDGGEWVVSGWSKYQGDPTARDRARAYRQSASRLSPSRSVTASHRDARDVTPTVTVTKTKTTSYDEPFEQLWSLCRRGSKPKALAEYRKAVPAKVDHAGMMASRMAHVTSASAPKYVAHLERWIRDERWQEVAGNGHRPVSGALARPRL